MNAIMVFDRDGKTNFVDANNVVVGYDNRQDCCESFWYEWLDKDRATIYSTEFTGDPYSPEPSDAPEPPSMKGFKFDPSYHATGQDRRSRLDEGGWAEFRAVSDAGEVRYLRLYNAHNGYYSHGFEMLVDGACVYDGLL